MHKNLSVSIRYLLLFSWLGFVACYPVYKTIPTVQAFDSNITLKVMKVMIADRIATGNGFWQASRGNRFFTLVTEFHNKSDKRQNLNLDLIALADPENKTKYKIEFSMMPGPVNLWGNIDSHINAGDTKTRKLVFIAPKDFKAAYLLVNDQLLPIEYQK